MLAQLVFWNVFGTVFLGTIAMASIALAIYLMAKDTSLFFPPLLVFLIMIIPAGACILAFGPLPNRTTLYVTEVAPGLYLTDNGELSYRDFPVNVRTVYEFGSSEKSGYTVRNWRWVRLVRINNPYDWRIAAIQPVLYQTDRQLALPGYVIDRPEIYEHYIEHCLRDNWWCQEHPDKPQGEITFLETPPRGTDARGPRLHTLVFDR